MFTKTFFSMAILGIAAAVGYADTGDEAPVPVPVRMEAIRAIAVVSGAVEAVADEELVEPEAFSTPAGDLKGIPPLLGGEGDPGPEMLGLGPRWCYCCWGCCCFMVI